MFPFFGQICDKHKEQSWSLLLTASNIIADFYYSLQCCLIFLLVTICNYYTWIIMLYDGFWLANKLPLCTCICNLRVTSFCYTLLYKLKRLQKMNTINSSEKFITYQKRFYTFWPQLKSVFFEIITYYQKNKRENEFKIFMELYIVICHSGKTVIVMPNCNIQTAPHLCVLDLYYN